MPDPILCPIADRTQVGEARRRAVHLARGAGLGEVPREKLALVVSELGTNLVKHGGGGELILRATGEPGAVEVLALDRGPGMSNVEQCFRDGYSTAGSAGTGLGAVRRLASSVDVYSTRPGGTAIVASVGPEEQPCSGERLEIGAVCVQKDGEDVCGDGWAAVQRRQVCHVLVADGLGHGVGAADASRLAVSRFAARPDQPPAAHMTALHEALRGTRGAAVAVARVDRAERQLAYAGLGNIAAAIVHDGLVRRLVSMNGTAGHEIYRISEFPYPWDDGTLLVLHSDGLGGRWDLGRYPGLAARHPSLVAGVLFRDFARRRDDVTVVVVRLRGV